MPHIVLPMTRHSVYESGFVEAMRYKWIESERAGHDLGEAAVVNWVRHHWNGFLRARWLEHLEGTKFWIELDQDDFGLLQYAFVDHPLMDEVIRRLKFGQENLDLILWAREKGHDVDEMIKILTTLDMNSRRIECQFCQRLAQVG